MTELTLEEFFDEYIIKASHNLSLSYPFHTFFILCVAIEILGKQLDGKKTSRASFMNALYSFESLNKYVNLNYWSKEDGEIRNSLYDLRCGFAHMFKPGGINCVNISQDDNDLNNNIIGCKSLLSDIEIAWNVVKSKYSKQIKHLAIKCEGSITGSTQTNISKQV